MSQNTATGLQVPTSGDSCDVPADMLALASDLDGVTIPLFSSTSDRDTAYSSTKFKMCVVGSDLASGTAYMRVGSDWNVVASISPTVTSGLSWGVQTGWTMVSYAVSKRAGHVDLLIQLKYTGTAIEMGSDGNTGNVPTLSVPAAYVPYAPFGQIPVFGWAYNSGDMLLTFALGAAGALSLVSGYPSATLASNSEVRISAGYAAGA